MISSHICIYVLHENVYGLLVSWYGDGRNQDGIVQ